MHISDMNILLSYCYMFQHLNLKLTREIQAPGGFDCYWAPTNVFDIVDAVGFLDTADGISCILGERQL